MSDNTAIEQRKQQPPALVQHINDLAPQLAKLGVDEQRFTRTLLTAVQQNKQLLQCTPMSFMAAAFHSAQLGLEPGPLEQVWFIPRKNRREGTVEVQWMLSYKGQIELARRVGVIVTAGIVHRGDHFAERQGSEPYIEHVPNHEDQGEAYLWYAVARFPDGRTIHRVLNKAEVERRRKMSSTPYKPGSPWYDHYDAMGRKTAVRALWSELPADPLVQRAASIDEQVLSLPNVAESRPALVGAQAAPSESARGMDEPDVPVPTTGDDATGQEPAPPPSEPPTDPRSLAELRDACGKAGLSKQGGRDDLVARLAAHEAGQDDAEEVEGEIVHEGGPPTPPPPTDPDEVPVDAEDADDDGQDVDEAGELDPADARSRLWAAFRTVAPDDPPTYSELWNRMLEVVGDPQETDVEGQVAAFAAADPEALSSLLADAEAHAARVAEERR